MGENVSLIDGHIDEPSMTDTEKKIYDCLFIQGLSAEETAEKVGYCERQIYRIKKKLRERLGV